MSAEVLSVLRELLAARLAPPAAAWLDAELEALGRPQLDEDRLSRAYTGAQRRAGVAPVEPGAAAAARLSALGVDQPLEVYTMDELTRAALLVAAAARGSDAEAAARLRRVYDDGDNRERRAVLRALPLCPSPARFVALGVEACRSHVLPIFEAIATDNVLPAEHFSELAFDQMALKAAFVELPLARIRKLDARRSPDLDRMARAYAAERVAAGRPVPIDLSLLYLP